jgi:competence CoiA-like predicted nuclease
MIGSEKIELPFGINQNNELVHINQVKRGKRCNLLCPVCLYPLIAVKGNKRQHHFRHTVDSECARNPESAIHLVAKKMIVEEMRIILPKWDINLYYKRSNYP